MKLKKISKKIIFFSLIIFLGISLFSFQALAFGKKEPIEFYSPKTNCQKWNKIGIILILSGALSNLIDRISFGCVLDFLKIPFWPLFNLADIWISVGGIILTVQIIRNSFLCPQK